MIEKNFNIKIKIDEDKFTNLCNKENLKTDNDIAKNIFSVLKSCIDDDEEKIVSITSVTPIPEIKPIFVFDEVADYFSKTKKVILNKSYGGFDISDKAVALYAKRKGLDFDYCNLRLDSSYREDPTLIEIVEELGPKASGKYGNLKVVEIPADMEYVVDDYDGLETLHKKVQEW